MLSKNKNTEFSKPIFNYLIKPSFQGVNRLFVLPFMVLDDRTEQSRFYPPTSNVEHYNVMLDVRNFFDQPIKNEMKHLKTFEKLKLGKEMITQLVVC